MLLNKEKVKKVLTQASKLSTIYLDTETTGLDWKVSKIIGLCFASPKNKEGYYVEWSNVPQDILKKILLNPKIRKVFHNAKYDLHMFRSHGLDYAGRIDDTMVMAKLFHKMDEKVSIGLKPLATKYIDPNADIAEKALWDELRRITPKGQDVDFSKAPLKLLADYGAKDPFYTMGLDNKFYKSVSEEYPDLYETERRLVLVTLEMEERGVPLDVKKIAVMDKVLAKQEVDIAKKIFKVAKKEFNLNSDDEMADLLYRKLQLPIIATSDKTGKPKVDEYTLNKLNHPIISTILEYRTANKLRTTFGLNLSEKCKDGILHCNFNSLGARTGRFSSSDPNLQNIPRQHGIRDYFICRKGFNNFYFDYSQIEMRLYTHYCRDISLWRALKDGEDLHALTASKVLGCSLEEAKKDEEKRKVGKRLNFGIIYCMGAATFARKFNMEEATCKQFIDRYFAGFPRAKAWKWEVINTVKKTGFITNEFGRKRLIQPDKAYTGINHLIQGCAADIIKRSMVRVYDHLKGTGANMLLQIHDELVIEIPKGQEQKLVPEILGIMEDFKDKDFSVDIKCDVEWTSTTWGAKKEWTPQAKKSS